MNRTDIPAPAAKANAFAALREGQAATFEFAVTDSEMATFAAISGDYNPLHCDTAFAASKGFEGRVVYGALLVAQVSRLIGMELPGRDSLWTGLEIQFVAPLLVGEHATLEASVAHLSPASHSVDLRLRIRCGERTIARGKASVSVRHGR